MGLGMAASGAVKKLSDSAVAVGPGLYVGLAVLFLVVALAAAYIPVRRASTVDPADALRCE
jgi:ABC-type lipoprotein release transport system permease subunit